MVLARRIIPELESEAPRVLGYHSSMSTVIRRYRRLKRG